MVAVDTEQRDWQFCKPLFQVDISMAAVIVDAGIAKDDQDIVRGGVLLFAKQGYAGELSVGIANPSRKRVTCNHLFRLLRFESSCGNTEKYITALVRI